MSLSNLKRRKKNFDKLASKVNGNNYQKDERFWEFTVDKMQNGEAVIRFLPGKEGDIEHCDEYDDPIILFRQYFIETPKGKFVCDARENAGLPSFPAEVATDIWRLYKKTNNEAYKEMFKKRVSKDYFIANIYVIKDPANPDNEGKVFLFKFGRQIKDMLFEQMGVESEAKKKSSILMDNMPTEPYDPFDLWDGADFYITSRSKTGKPINRTYEDSKFLERKPLLENDAELAHIYSQVHSLQEFLSPDKYEDYEEQKRRYIDMTGDYYNLFPDKDVHSKSEPEYNREPIKRDVSSVTEPPFEPDEPSDKFVNSNDNTTSSDDDDWSEYDDILNGR